MLATTRQVEASEEATAEALAEIAVENLYYDSMVEYINGLIAIFETCTDVFDNPWRTYNAPAYRTVTNTLRDLRSSAAHGLMPSNVKMGSFRVLTDMNAQSLNPNMEYHCVEAVAWANVAAKQAEQIGIQRGWYR